MASAGSDSPNQTTSGRIRPRPQRAPARGGIDLVCVGGAPAIVFAARASDVAVEFDHVRVARPLMKAVHVLRDEREALEAAVALERGERAMTGVRLRFAHAIEPPAIPAPHAFGIAREGLRRGEILGAESFPQSARAAEDGHAALGRHAGAGEHHEALGRAGRGDEVSGEREGVSGHWGSGADTVLSSSPALPRITAIGPCASGTCPAWRRL